MIRRNGRPVVSVVVPTHNRPALLREALASVRAQQGSGERFEIDLVVVDDGSTVDLREVVDEFAPASLLRFEERRGVPAARNVGLQHSRGEYVAFLDDDDVWFAHKLQTQLPPLEADPSAGMVYGQVFVTVDGAGGSVWPDATQAPSGWILADMVVSWPVNTLAVVARRAVFDAVGGFDETLPTWEDDDMWVRIAHRYPCVFVPGVVAHYRRSSSGKSRTSVIEGPGEATRWQVLERALSLLPEELDPEEIRRRARAAMSVRTAQIMWQIGEFAKAEAYLRAGLEETPALVHQHEVRGMIKMIARALAQGSPAPWAAVRSYSADIDRQLAALPESRALRRQEQSEIWFQAAKVWSQRHRYGLAMLAAGLAVVQRPSRGLSTLRARVVRLG
jgi:GT2 family glycosyltransferase